MKTVLSKGHIKNVPGKGHICQLTHLTEEVRVLPVWQENYFEQLS